MIEQHIITYREEANELLTELETAPPEKLGEIYAHLAQIEAGRAPAKASEILPGLGFGLGFEVRTRVGDAALPGSLGEYGWAGNAGTLFWVDPKEQLFAIYMVQVSDPDRIALRNQFRSMVQSAIID